MLSKPAAVAEVLVHDCYKYTKPSMLRDLIGGVLGIGLLFAEGDEHKQQRKSLGPAFHFGHIQKIYPPFWQKSRELAMAVSKIVDEQISLNITPCGTKSTSPYAVVEVGGWFNLAALDIIALAGLGQVYQSTANPRGDMTRAYEDLLAPHRFNRIMQLICLVLPPRVFRKLPFRRCLEINTACSFIKRNYMAIIQQKREQQMKREASGVDILSCALQSNQSDTALVDQLITFFAAGHDTTAAAMMWAVYCLGRYPHVQQRIRADIRNLPDVFDSEATVTAADLDGKPYLTAFCNEVLRLYPPVPWTERVAAQDTTILGHRIPGGTVVIIPIMAINRDPAVWDSDTAEFDPERWIRNKSLGGASSNYGFLSFLAGPRSCIGQSFARAELACLLVGWVKTFKMQLENPEAAMELSGRITMRPRWGLKVKLRRSEEDLH